MAASPPPPAASDGVVEPALEGVTALEVSLLLLPEQPATRRSRPAAATEEVFMPPTLHLSGQPGDWTEVLGPRLRQRRCLPQQHLPVEVQLLAHLLGRLLVLGPEQQREVHPGLNEVVRAVVERDVVPAGGAVAALLRGPG